VTAICHPQQSGRRLCSHASSTAWAARRIRRRCASGP